jgi:hypothetical protein
VIFTWNGWNSPGSKFSNGKSWIGLTEQESDGVRLAVVAFHRDDFPELARQLHVAIAPVVIAEDRAVEHADPALVQFGLIGDMVFEIAPQQKAALRRFLALVEYFVLRRAIGPVESVVIAFLRLVLRLAPGPVLPAGQVALVERIVGIDLGAGLHEFRQARVVAPAIRALASDLRAGVDIPRVRRGNLAERGSRFGEPTAAYEKVDAGYSLARTFGSQKRCAKTKGPGAN